MITFSNTYLHTI